MTATSVWIGIDAGKTSRHVAAIEALGKKLRSVKVGDGQRQIEELIERAAASVAKTGGQVGWAVDLVSPTAALPLAILLANSRHMVYVPGRVVNGMAGIFRGEGKTDAKDARIIADTARMRGDLAELTATDELVVETGFLHRQGAWRKGIDAMATTAQQSVALPGEATSALLVKKLARQLLELDREIKNTDKLITSRFHTHPQAHIIESLPGMGSLLGAQFVVATGGDVRAAFAHVGRPASYAGLASVPRDSGRVTGNNRRPKRFKRPLRQVFAMAALSGIRADGLSQSFYQRKRDENKLHVQDLLAVRANPRPRDPGLERVPDTLPLPVGVLATPRSVVPGLPRS
ncbi:IS110 family transposase [Streptosporangium sp. H16]|uniref:IS110 family transposase n=1 Tax=Streptosporangium sp. H16 TaxID=3444184 RepID=UPI003F7ADDF1